MPFIKDNINEIQMPLNILYNISDYRYDIMKDLIMMYLNGMLVMSPICVQCFMVVIILIVIYHHGIHQKYAIQYVCFIIVTNLKEKD